MKLIIPAAFQSFVTDGKSVKVLGSNGAKLIVQLDKDVEVLVAVEGFKAAEVKAGKITVNADGTITTDKDSFIKKKAEKTASTTGSTPRGAGLERFA